MTTIKDVARVAGVSVSTVSIVLRGQAKSRKIPQQTEEKILTAARSINYQPNLSARKLRDVAEEQYTIGLFWAADARTIVLAKVLKGVQQVLVEGHHHINLVVSPYSCGRICENTSLRGFTNYNAAIIANTDENDNRYLEENPPNFPIVLYNRDSRRFSSVMSDNDAAGKIAAEQFVSRGLTRIGTVLQDNPFIAMLKRSDSFFRACEEYGIMNLRENTLLSDGTVSGGFEAGMKIIESGNIPQGIYCDSDSTALGLQNAFSRHPEKLRDAVRLVAIGTAPTVLTQYGTPPVTLIELPLEEMAIQSVNLLVDLLQHKVPAPQRKVLPPRLIVRTSDCP